MDTKLCYYRLPIQQFHTSRLAQSHVTVANQIVYSGIASTQKPTKRRRPLPVYDTESDLCWGWLGWLARTT